jgi:hypothetical protein
MGRSFDISVFADRLTDTLIEEMATEEYIGVICDRKTFQTATPGKKDGVRFDNIAPLGPTRRKYEFETIGTDRMIPGWSQEANYITNSLQITMTEELVEDAKLDMLNAGRMGLPYAAKVNMQLRLGQMFDDFFTGALYKAPDGGPAGSVTHTERNLTGVVRKNILATPSDLGYQSLQDLLILGLRQVNSRGLPEPSFRPGMRLKLVVPPELYMKAVELTNPLSKLIPINNANAVNVLHQFQWDIITMSYLADTGQWYIQVDERVTPRNARTITGALFVERVAPTTKAGWDEVNDRYYARIRHRDLFVWENSFGTYGSGNPV